MATLTPKLTLTSSDISSSEQLNLTLTDSLTVDGPVETKRLAIDSGAGNLAATNIILLAASYSKSYTLLYNTSLASSGEIITVGTVSGTDAVLLTSATQISLAPGEWAFFPWESDINLVADASSGTPVLEVRIFQNIAS
tara:strand:+ start:66 stop:482 length:417 start_codon:yes stop_codon:yes gene_type:complete